MATTNLQVNANTQQAVGAFNNLTNAVTGSRNAFNSLNSTMASGNQQAKSYGSGLQQHVGGAFDKLSGMVSTFFGVLTKIGAGIELVFTSIIRELDKIQGFQAMMAVTTKSTEEAGRQFDWLRGMADRLGVQFDALAGNYSKLLAAMPEGENRLRDTQKAFLGVAMAARTLHSSNQDTQLMFYAITQMASKGVVSMEELRRQLGEKLPGVLNIAAKALNTTVEQLTEKVGKGLVQSAKFVPILAEGLIKTFSESSEMASQSVSASINRLTNVWVDFTKKILDSGAGKAIIGVFDALREKLSDPYLIERFAALIKYLAERFTDFIKNITADDLRNGFDTFARFVNFAVEVMGKLIQAFTWVINNGPKAGLIIGAVAGAAMGSNAGPIGMAAGAGAGAIAGYFSGKALAPTQAEKDQRVAADAAAGAAKAAAEEATKQLVQEARGYLSIINGVDQGVVDKLTDAGRLTRGTVDKLKELVTKAAITPKEKAIRNEKIGELAKYGMAFDYTGAQLKDVLGPGKPKKGSTKRDPMDAAFNRAVGLDANFFEEWERYSALFKKGKLSTEQLEKAQAELLSKQPFMEEMARKEKEAFDFTTKAISETIKEIEAKDQALDKINRGMNDERRMAEMSAEDRQLEEAVAQKVNYLLDHKVTVTERMAQLIRDEVRETQRVSELRQSMDQSLAATVEQYRTLIVQLQGMKALMADPKSGFAKIDAQSILVGQNSSQMEGSDEYFMVQQKKMQDYYAYVESLRQADLISANTAEMMKARTAIEYQEMRLAGTRTFFDSLATLSSASNKTLATIGRSAAIAQATIDGILAVQKALASSPPPYNYIAAAAVGISAAANVAKIAGVKGFAAGGYTGNGGRDQIAGVTHGQEFVVKADATARNRAALEAMNRGQTFDQAGDRGAVTVNVINNSDNSRARQEQRQTAEGTEIEVTIENVVARSISSGGKVSQALEGQYNINRAASMSF